MTATMNVQNRNNVSQVMYIGTTSPLGKAKRNAFPIKGSNRHRDGVSPGLSTDTHYTIHKSVCQ